MARGLDGPVALDEQARAIGDDASVAGCVDVADAPAGQRGAEARTEVGSGDERQAVGDRQLCQHVVELSAEEGPLHLHDERGRRPVRGADAPLGVNTSAALARLTGGPKRPCRREGVGDKAFDGAEGPCFARLGVCHGPQLLRYFGLFQK
jgi:hypothetical protein